MKTLINWTKRLQCSACSQGVTRLEQTSPFHRPSFLFTLMWVTLLSSFPLCVSAAAQRRGTSDATGAAGCAACGGITLFFLIGLPLLGIALLI
jgi:hypothetical protein